jgi:hypothetical protein
MHESCMRFLDAIRSGITIALTYQREAIKKKFIIGPLFHIGAFGFFSRSESVSTGTL